MLSHITTHVKPKLPIIYFSKECPFFDYFFSIILVA